MTEPMQIDSEPDRKADGAPWVEKYRPSDLDDVVAHQDIISTIDRFIDKNQLPHMLFYGPPGTGKTTTILAIAKKLYGKAIHNNTLELNASDDRGIDVVRDEIKTFASSRIIFGGGDDSTVKYKLVILDEADMMTQVAQSALRRVIEKYTNNVRFCIICNHVYKIIPAIQSRCTRFRFGPLPTDQVEKRIQYVASAEHVNLTEDGLHALLRLTRGDMRRALNILQACHTSFSTVDEQAIYRTTGQPYPADIEAILSSMMEKSFENALSFIQKLKMEKGLALQDVLAELYKLVIEYDMPSAARIFLLQEMSKIEYHLAAGCSEKLQLTALVSAAKITVELSDTS